MGGECSGAPVAPPVTAATAPGSGRRVREATAGDRYHRTVPAPAPSAADGPAATEPDRAPTAGPVPRPLAVVAVAAVVVGVVARFVAPTPLWLDEALSADIAALPVGDLLDALGRDGHPPLYYLVLHGWMRVVGTGDVAVRALSGLVSVAALPLVYLAGRRRGGPVLATVALTVLALSPFAIRYATEARMYSLVVLEVLLGWLLVDDLVAGRASRWRAPALAVVSGALLLTHYWAVPLLGATVVVLAVAWWRSPPGGADRRGLRTAGLAVAVGGLAFLPWLPTFADQVAHTGTPWAPPTRPSAAVGAVLRDVAGGPLDDGVLAAVVLAVLAVVGLLGRPGGPGRIELVLRTVPTVRPEAAVAGLTLVGGATVAYLGGSAVVTRYAAVVLALVVLVVAAGVVCVTPTRAQVAVLVVLCATGLTGVVAQLSEDRTQAGDVAAAVEARLAQPGAGERDAAVVVTCPDQLGPATARALWGPPPLGADPEPGRPAVLAYPALDDPRLVDWYDYADRAAAADPAAAAERVLAEAGPDGSVVLVWHTTYRGFEGQCEALRDALSRARPGAEDLVRADGAAFFEPATVTWFPPVAR